jgi:hypothetical protein
MISLDYFLKSLSVTLSKIAFKARTAKARVSISKIRVFYNKYIKKVI